MLPEDSPPRPTPKRVLERLRDEHGFTGGYTIIKDFMREHERRTREMFVPLSHPAGHAQADFGEAMVIIDGVEQKAHYFAFDLPHSDACYVRAYPAATAEAWMDGHIHAFAFFGGVPQSVLYGDRYLTPPRKAMLELTHPKTRDYTNGTASAFVGRWSAVRGTLNMCQDSGMISARLLSMIQKRKGSETFIHNFAKLIPSRTGHVTYTCTASGLSTSVAVRNSPQ